MKNSFIFSPAALAELARLDVARALAEDMGAGDLTAGLIDGSAQARAHVLARESAVICGRPWVEATLFALDPLASIHWFVKDGERCQANQIVLEMSGNARALLSAERTCLNFLQFLSAVASKTALYVSYVAGTAAKIVDTDNGLLHKLRTLNPGKTFIEAPTSGNSATCKSCAHCPWMAMNGLAGLAHVLELGMNEIHINPALGLRARQPIDRMLAFAAASSVKNAPALVPGIGAA